MTTRRRFDVIITLLLRRVSAGLIFMIFTKQPRTLQIVEFLSLSVTGLICSIVDCEQIIDTLINIGT